MSTLALTRRHIKLFFKDKGLFFTSLITPAILLVLFVTFLGKVYTDSMNASFPAGFLSEKLVRATVGGQLVSSLLAVVPVTVAFSSNLLSVADKTSGAKKDLTMAPLPPFALPVSYYLSTAFSTLTVTYGALALCSVYLAAVGWYLTFADLLTVMGDLFLLAMFGTALSSLIDLFLTTEGQMTAVTTVIGAGYGFLCGAYMPIAGFGEGLRKAITLLPSTHGTSLLRRHVMQGVFRELESAGVPAETVQDLARSIDCRLFLGGTELSAPLLYGVLCGTVLFLLGAYILFHILMERKRTKA